MTYPELQAAMERRCAWKLRHDASTALYVLEVTPISGSHAPFVLSGSDEADLLRQVVGHLPEP